MSSSKAAVGTVAILGSTSHIAKGLIYYFFQDGRFDLKLFARSESKVRDFVRSLGHDLSAEIGSLDKFAQGNYDVIINCIGIGSAVGVGAEMSAIFRVNESFDNIALEYVLNNPEALYINFSSGAAYGTDFSEPANDRTCTKWDINHLTAGDFYGLTKLYAEAKHRSLDFLNIVDLRVFSYFSRFIDLKSRFLLTEILSCVMKGETFLTDSVNIVRDFIHPQDLFRLVEKCIEKRRINNVFDVYSMKPVTKFEVIEYFAGRFGLKYKIKDDIDCAAVTGRKINYFSSDRKAKDIGYEPRFSSLDCIIQETEALMSVVS